MIDKTLLGYAILDYYSNKNMDILDTYIPLFCSCLISSGLEKVDRDIMKQLLQQTYGFESITLGAIESILIRMRTRKFLYQEKKVLYVDSKKILSFKEEHPESGLEEKFDILVNDILLFSRNFPDINFTSDQIKAGLLAFLEIYDGDILFADENFTDVLAKQKKKRTIKYVISKYILDVYDSKPETVKVLMQLAKGHAISKVVTLKNFDAYIGKLDKLVIALDAPIVFNLLGLNGESNYRLVLELMNILKDNKASFIMFNKNYNEVVNTINDAYWRLKTGNFDFDKSSRVLRFAKRNHKSPDFLQTKLQQVEQVLTDWNVSIEDAPNLVPGYKEIDREN